MSKKGFLTLPRSPELERHHPNAVKCHIKTLFFMGESFTLCKRYSQHILSPANKAKTVQKELLILSMIITTMSLEMVELNHKKSLGNNKILLIQSLQSSRRKWRGGKKRCNTVVHFKFIWGLRSSNDVISAVYGKKKTQFKSLAVCKKR